MSIKPSEIRQYPPTCITHIHMGRNIYMEITNVTTFSMRRAPFFYDHFLDGSLLERGFLVKDLGTHFGLPTTV